MLQIASLDGQRWPCWAKTTDRASIWSSGFWPWPALAIVAKAMATVRAMGVRRINNSMILSFGSLAWSPPPRDEKAVRAVLRRGEDPPRAGGPSAGNGELFRNHG